MKQISLLISILLLIKCSHQVDPPLFRCNQKADIIFLVDSSGSIGKEDFQRVRDFLVNVTQMLSTSDVRFGLVSFADIAVKHFDLNTYSNQLDLENAILNIRYTAGTTATSKALELVLASQLFDTANGGRTDAPDVIITLTDGISNVKTDTAVGAQMVKEQNVTMITIGIGSLVDLTELQTLSSKNEYILLVKNFPDLMTVVTPLLNLASIATTPGVLVDCLTTASTTTSTTSTTTASTLATTPSTTTANTTRIDSTLTATTRRTTTANKIVEINASNICHGSEYVRGVAHLPYPEDCTKVIQCYHNPISNKTLAVIRRCPLGQFWNQQTLDCDPSWTVNCPYEKCNKECEANSPWDSSMIADDGTMTYPMSGKRRGYYKCIDGKSYPRCCPEGSVFVPGIGCHRNWCLTEKCGPEESCKEGISLCKKLPVWDNRKSYLENSLVLGHYPVSCVSSEFNIVDCWCDEETLNKDRNITSECAPTFKTQRVAENCSEEIYDELIVSSADVEVFTIKLTLSLPSPHFQVMASPQTNCQDCYTLKIWGDLDTLNFAMGNKRDGIASQATLLWENASGDLDFVVMVRGTQLTFGVSQGERQVVTLVEAVWTNKAFVCTYHIKAESGFKNRCILNKLEVFTCPYRFDNIWQ